MGGITLIALVITIIVLLILAGISIYMLSGNNSIIQKSTLAKQSTERVQVVEQAKIDVMSWINEKTIAGEDTTLNDNKVKEIITGKKYVKEVKTNSFIASNGEYEILYSELYSKNGTVNPPQEWRTASEVFETSGSTEGKMHVGDIINYPIYYDNVAGNVDPSTGYESEYPNDSYKGWKVLAKGGEGSNQYLVLISSGVPLNYYLFSDDGANSVNNLTTSFFDIQIDPSACTYSNFQRCGFKTSEDGEIINDIQDLYSLFENEYTAKYASGESASYTDNTLGQTFTNSSVEGKPKVRSMTKEDIEAVLGTTINSEYDISSNNLFAIPCKESNRFSSTWIASSFDSTGTAMLYIDSHKGIIGLAGDIGKGVRCVVSLASNIEYALANGSSASDTVKTWDIR